MQKDEKYSGMTREIIRYCGDLDNKIILEAGADPSLNLAKSLIEAGAGRVIGVNPVIEREVNLKNIELKKYNASQMPFEDNYFDTCVSLAAFEHFHELELSLKEIYRVLKPGGLLYTMFGPIWSCQIGHHLWTSIGDKVYNYKNTVLPPYAHLLMQQNEIVNYCISVLGYELFVAEKIAEYCMNSPEQNKMFFSDYKSSFDNSDFNVLLFFPNLNVPIRKENNLSIPDLYSNLKQKYPDKWGFEFGVIRALLRK